MPSRLVPGAAHDRLETIAARVGLTRERAERTLNRALTFDDDIAEALFSKDRRVRTWTYSPGAGAQGPHLELSGHEGAVRTVAVTAHGPAGSSTESPIDAGSRLGCFTAVSAGTTTVVLSLSTGRAVIAKKGSGKSE